VVGETTVLIEPSGTVATVADEEARRGEVMVARVDHLVRSDGMIVGRAGLARIVLPVPRRRSEP
jgi:hypothetical protein